jgi:hypothetical protein
MFQQHQVYITVMATGDYQESVFKLKSTKSNSSEEHCWDASVNHVLLSSSLHVLLILFIGFSAQIVQSVHSTAAAQQRIPDL